MQICTTFIYLYDTQDRERSGFETSAVMQFTWKHNSCAAAVGRLISSALTANALAVYEKLEYGKSSHSEVSVKSYEERIQFG